MNRKNGVDFVIVSCYGENKIDYTKYNHSFYTLFTTKNCFRTKRK